MHIIILIFLLGLYYIGLKMKTKGMISESRTQKVISNLNRFVMISPLIGLIIFALLFTTLLKGRLVDRSSHALIVFVLWMLATSFYIEVLRQFKNKKLLIISVIGMAIGVTLAIILTPLDRYCSIINTSMYGFIYGLGILLLIFIYVGFALINRK